MRTEFITATGCTVSVHYVSQASVWDAPGVWLVLRMPSGDARAATVVLHPGEAADVARELEIHGEPELSWQSLKSGPSYRVVELSLREFEPPPGIYLLLRKPDGGVTIELRLTDDEAAQMSTALWHVVDEALADA